MDAFFGIVGGILVLPKKFTLGMSHGQYSLSIGLGVDRIEEPVRVTTESTIISADINLVIASI